MKLLPAAALALALGQAQACGEALGAGARRIESAPWQLVYRLQPDPVPVGRHFTIDIALCGADGSAAPAELRVDATMPEHRHGMNYQPRVQRLAPGRYRAEGLLFHMPGRWELVFELHGSGAPLRLTQSLQVE